MAEPIETVAPEGREVVPLGEKPVKPLPPGEELRLLMPYIEMMDGAGWRSFVQTVEGELRTIENWSWRVGGPVPVMRAQSVQISKLMDELGCKWPTTKEEMFELWGNFRAVVNYFRSKLATMQRVSERVEQLKGIIREEEARQMEGKK